MSQNKVDALLSVLEGSGITTTRGMQSQEAWAKARAFFSATHAYQDLRLCQTL